MRTAGRHLITIPCGDSGSAITEDVMMMIPIPLGYAPASDFSDPLQVMSDCHRRIERFLDVLSRVTAEARGRVLSPELRSAFTMALDYFRDAAPIHNHDEEDSLFPRLRRAAAFGRQESLHSVTLLEQDHYIVRIHHAEVDRLGRQWLRDGWLPDGAQDDLTNHLAALTDIYQDHIATEEAEIYPMADSLLSEADKRAIGREMAARRGIDLDAIAAWLAGDPFRKEAMNDS